MSSSSNASSGGIGFVGLLTIVFITLKLCGVIDWSWWWVFMPVIFSAAFWIVVAAIMLVVIVKTHSD